MQQRVSEQSFTVSFIGRDVFLFSPRKPREIFFEIFIYRWIDKFRESDDCDSRDEFHGRKSITKSGEDRVLRVGASLFRGNKENEMSLQSVAASLSCSSKI